MSLLSTYLDKLILEISGTPEQKQDIRAEMEDHLLQLKQTYLAKGYTDEDAEKCAVIDFGQADEVGRGIQESLSSSRRVMQLGAWLFLLFYLYVILRITLFGTIMGDHPNPLDEYWVSTQWLHALIPLNEITTVIMNQYHGNWSLMQISLHFSMRLLAFLPVGLLLPYLVPKAKRFVHLAILSSIASFAILLIGHITGYAFFSIDRMLLHLLGSTIGWSIFHQLCRQEMTTFLRLRLTKTALFMGMLGFLTLACYYSWNTYAAHQPSLLDERLSQLTARLQPASEIPDSVLTLATKFVNDHLAMRKIVAAGIIEDSSTNRKSLRYTYPASNEIDANGNIERAEGFFLYSASFYSSVQIGTSGPTIFINTSQWMLSSHVSMIGNVLLALSALLFLVAASRRFASRYQANQIKQKRLT